MSRSVGMFESWEEANLREWNIFKNFSQQHDKFAH